MPLNYITSGSASRNAIVLLHGFMGCGGDWHEVASRLESRYFCIMPDLSGHGSTPLSDFPGDYTIEAAGRFIIELLDNQQIERAVLAGYSMGGRIALYTALEYQERFSALVLESTSPGLRTERERAERMAADEKHVEKLEKLGIEKFIEYWYDMPLFASLTRHPGWPGMLKRRRMTNSREGLILSLRGVGTGSQPSLWSRLHDLRMPVLLVCGELDSKFVGINTEMSALMRNHRLRVIPGAGHNVHFERPGEFCRAVQDLICEYKPENQEIEDHVEH